MSQDPDCPYCGTSVRVDHLHTQYNEKIKVQCQNCGGRFEFMPGFGSFSLPGEGPTTQRRVMTDGSYSDPSYQGGDPWGAGPPKQRSSGCGTCCAICFCLILLLTFVPIFWLFGGFFWLFG